MGATTSSPNLQSKNKEENEEDNIQKFRKNKNKEGDSDYDDEDDSFDSESDKEDLVSENRGQELNGKFKKKVAALHGDGSRMFDDYPGEIKDDE